MGAKDSFRILVGKLIKFALLIAVLYGIGWCYFNWEYVRERFGAKYEIERYGVVWSTNLNTAKRLAEKHDRKIMVVYLHSNAKNETCDYLIDRVFTTSQFRQAVDTYIPVLADVREGDAEESVRAKTNRDEIVNAYDLRNQYGQLLLLDREGKEIGRVRYAKEPSYELLNKLAGGKFEPLPPISKPDVKDPFTESKEKAKNLTKSVSGPKEDAPKVEERYGITTGL